MIDIDTAAELLDFGARIGSGPRADEQLRGAVAIHNLLASKRVAYLADEVGMGKTYVALGALALFRHYDPNFRVLVIAPRENIQNKWMKEMRNFVAHNVRFPDLRVKAIDGRPAVPLIACGSLVDFAREVAVDPKRDFFLRLTSFSLPVKGREEVDPEAAKRLREGFRRHLPWLRAEVFDRRNRRAFKENCARALCCLLPRFDLVIVDEGHNLKHGCGVNASARNRLLALAMGHPDGDFDRRLFPGFGARAKRVLFLSATPVDESYAHLLNQLDVFALGNSFVGLRDKCLDDDGKKEIAKEFLVRRVTSIQTGSEELTKNLYRREWRRGGVYRHDEPIKIEDPKQRLIVALVQKKVSELLGHERFNTSFQIGMLASFESFMDTAKLKREIEASNFDDDEQTEDELEREGIDVADVNRLSRNYREQFGAEMPHPKMDALVDSLSHAWDRGEKSLVFVRRIASVKELKQKLDERYDEWLRKRLLHELPPALHPRLERLFRQYRAERIAAISAPERRDALNAGRSVDEQDDMGGKDTFFAWFFRGVGPRGVISGANIQQRFIQRGATYSTFFADNYVANLLGCAPADAETRLAETLDWPLARLRAQLRERSRRYLSRAKKPPRADRFDAVQAAALELLRERDGSLGERASIISEERFTLSRENSSAFEAPEVGGWLCIPTFFSLLRERPELRQRLWPESRKGDFRAAFRESELRGQLLATAARLGHAFIDLYAMTMRRLGAFELRTQESAEGVDTRAESVPVYEYLDLLEKQMRTPLSEREYRAFDELSEIAEHFDLILDVNEPEARDKPLAETARVFGQLLRQQQPTGGMSGQVNQTLVRQFRMPGYPLVLVTTDLLQEGEDLHTFCSRVYHYGIAWTPSAMEQRIGRIDRVRSHTERRLAAAKDRSPVGDELLQVFFPHLEDSVELLQVQRVLERMDRFLHLMHEGLTTSGCEERTINAAAEFVRGRRIVPQITERLETAFPIRSSWLDHPRRGLAVDPSFARRLGVRFARLRALVAGTLRIDWDKHEEPALLLGTAHVGNRIQPFSLHLRSLAAWPVVQCISPVGRVRPGVNQDSVMRNAASGPVRVGATETVEDSTYDLTVQDEVILPVDDESTDAHRVAQLIGRIVMQADRLEQAHLPGRDAPLGEFKADLTQEAKHGR